MCIHHLNGFESSEKRQNTVCSELEEKKENKVAHGQANTVIMFW